MGRSLLGDRVRPWRSYGDTDHGSERARQGSASHREATVCAGGSYETDVALDPIEKPRPPGRSSVSEAECCLPPAKAGEPPD